MLHFVWSDPVPLYSGRGGTETYTIGHIQELLKSGIPARIVTYGHGKADGRQFHPGIPFYAMSSLNELSDMDGPIVYINIPHNVPTKQPAFVMFHFPPLEMHGTRAKFISHSKNKTLLANSYFLQEQIASFLQRSVKEIAIAHPFADPAFAKVRRPTHFTKRKTRVLFAGRLHPEKGIYTFLEALHHAPLQKGFEFTVTNAGSQTENGQIIERLLRAHPWIKVVSAKHERSEMAGLFAQHDIVVMPSNHQYWHEGFGMVSVEAQHAGCRVVASDDGGLPETDCGLLTLVEPGNSWELAKGIADAAAKGPANALARAKVKRLFTRAASVNALLSVVGERHIALPVRSLAGRLEELRPFTGLDPQQDLVV